MAIAQSIEERIENAFKLRSKTPQEVLVFGTNKSQDGYITGGYLIGKYGLYAGIPFSQRSNVVNQSNGTVSGDMRFGVLSQLNPNKLMIGAGVQPTITGTKLHSFVAYNPLRSKDMKLWLIGNVTGSVFSLGAGLSYKIK